MRRAARRYLGEDENPWFEKEQAEIDKEESERNAWPFVAGADGGSPVVNVEPLLDVLSEPRKPSRREKIKCPAEQEYSVPKLGRLILLLVPARSRAHLTGDLEEQYCTEIYPQYGRFWARCWWWMEVLGVIRPYVWQRVRRALSLQNLRRPHL